MVHAADEPLHLPKNGFEKGSLELLLEDGTYGFTVKKGENVSSHAQVCFYTYSDEDEVCKGATESEH